MIKNCDEKNWTLAFCFLSIFITTLSISSHSLWIDEGITTWFAFQDTFKDVIHTLNRTKMAESLIQQEMKDNKNNFLLDWKKPALFSVPFFLVLGGYYLKVILAGSGGRLQGGYGILTYKHVLFCLYEFLGFSGIGPPRNIIRENPSISTFSPYSPWLGVAVLIMIGALVYIMILYKKDSADKLFFMNPYMWGLIFGFLSFGIFAFNFKITFYGRHVIFLYPYFIFAIALIAKEAWSTKSRLKLRYVLVASLLLIWLVSDFRLRFHPGYFKDDYRSAVSTALSLAADSAPIFWAADLHAGAYYGLEYYNSDFKVPPKIKPIRKVYDASGWPAEKVKASVKPFSSGVLVISKKDTFDTKNGWSWYISQHKVKEQIKFNAFTIYRYNF